MSNDNMCAFWVIWKTHAKRNVSLCDSLSTSSLLTFHSKKVTTFGKVAFRFSERECWRRAMIKMKFYEVANSTHPPRTPSNWKYWIERYYQWECFSINYDLNDLRRDIQRILIKMMSNGIYIQYSEDLLPVDNINFLLLGNRLRFIRAFLFSIHREWNTRQQVIDNDPFIDCSK